MSNTQQSPSFFVDTKGEAPTDDYISFSPNTSQSHPRQNRPYFNNYRHQNNRQNSPYYNRNQNNFNPQRFSSPISSNFKRSPYNNSNRDGGGNSSNYQGNNRRGKQHYGFGYQNKQFGVCMTFLI